MLFGLELVGVLFARVTQRLDVLVAEQSVVVEVRLGVEGEHVAGSSDHQRVDLEQRTIEVAIGREHLAQKARHLAGCLALRAQTVGQRPGLEALEPKGRVHRDLEDLLGVRGCDLLDIHAPLARGHDRHPSRVSVEGRRQVQLGGDVHALLDEQTLDLLALFAGLNRDQGATEHLPGELLDRVCALDHLHTTEIGVLLEAALAASTGVDLGLDDDDLAAGLGDQFDRRRVGLFDRECHLRLGDGDPRLAQQLFGLILVNLHGCWPVIGDSEFVCALEPTRTQ